VRAALESLGGAVHDTPTFDPTISTRTFSLSTTDEISATFLPALARRMGETAPGIQLDIRSPLRGDEVGPLFRNELDVLFRPKPETTAGLAMAPLYTDGFSCLVRRDHPGVNKRLTLKRFIALPHVLVAPRDTGPGPGVVDAALARLGLQRHVQVYTRYFVSAPEIVAQTDCVLTLPTRLARIAASRLPVRLLAPPVALEPFTVYRIWSATRTDDPALAWFNATLAETAGELE
jgi:DNA-binding transcriptional LysR family regulator